MGDHEWSEDCDTYTRVQAVRAVCERAGVDACDAIESATGVGDVLVAPDGERIGWVGPYEVTP